MNAPIRNNYTAHAITDDEAFAALEPEWTALYESVEAAHLTDSYEWAQIGWRWPQGGRKPCIIVVRRLGRAIAILPLSLSRRRPWGVATTLDRQGAQYCPFLIEPQANPALVVAALEQALKQVRGLDALLLKNVRDDTRLGEWLHNRRGAVRTLSSPSASMSFAGVADWESYLDGRAHHLRAHVRRRSRQAARLGVEFCEVTDPQERQTMVAWLVAHKKAALARKNMNDWLFTPEYAEFVAATVDQLGPALRPIFALKLDGNVIAGELYAVDRRRAEMFITTYDEAHGKISPGVVIREHAARWCFERGLDCDFGPGDEPYKYEWGNDYGQVSTQVVALTSRGWLFLGLERSRRWAGHRMPEHLRAKARTTLQGLRGRGTIAAPALDSEAGA